ncbi:hypothetical protein CgunFtcFv8_008255 [Champsocephalus gunnari]|uniref:Uncharacterized protein n=1 Tax=Champsocephalus gunnari TaxID=52237 RepID=A0AAN8D200_CHAGU|nr:hypothetical protein CgunFtcFv8_008255 [Champsocephalus gunnari]
MMAKNINNKMSTMIEILSEIDGGEDAMTRSKTEAQPPLQEIDCFRNRSGISSLSRPLPPSEQEAKEGRKGFIHPAFGL